GGGGGAPLGAPKPQDRFAILSSTVRMSPALGRILGSIEQDEYNITWQSQADAYMSPNRAQNLRFTYLDDGFVVERRVHTGPGDDWKVSFELTGIGGQPLPEVFADRFRVARNTARADLGPVQFQYVNDTHGLRQDFVVRERPGKGPFALHLGVQAQGLMMDPDRGEIVFRDVLTGAAVLRYGGVNVFDRVGKRLPAEMKPDGQQGVLIAVKDAGAVYPVTIDPWLCAATAFLWINNPPPHNPPPGWLWSEQNLLGEQTDGQFGFSVGYANNLNNGDGWSGAMIVGAPFFDNGFGADAGKVYVYYNYTGSYGPDPGWTATGDQAHERFGYSVAGSDRLAEGVAQGAQEVSFFGDLSYDVLIVGAPGYNTSAGAVFVWRGSVTGLAPGNAANGNLTPDWMSTGDNETYAEFGFSVASAGDYNGDGALDIVVGEPYFSFGADNPEMGVVDIFPGDINGNPRTTPLWGLYSGNNNYGHFGWSVARAGNVNGDYAPGGEYPYDDILVGAPDETNAFNEAAGQAYVYLGGSDPSFYPQVVLTDSGSKFGWSVASLGLANAGDTMDAVIIGEPGYGGNEGAVAAYFPDPGGAGIVGDSRWFAAGTQGGEQLGWSVAGGDLNGDGNSEAIAGAPYGHGPGNTADSGVVYVWAGPLAAGVIDPAPDAYLSTDEAGDELGSSLAYFAVSGQYNNGQVGFLTGLPGAEVCDNAPGGGTQQLGQYGAVEVWPSP
ncbi:MAG: integrin alpha, partial [Verrucomicrobia bacterium]|nr:integrin alpha [Verrucomicrobiota bacterium]